VRQRRRHNRHEPLSKIQVAWRASGDYEISVISDFSQDGAFIHTSKPPEPGTLLHLLLDVPTNGIRAQAIVRRCVAGEGMGVEFQPMAREEHERFEGLLGVAVPLLRQDTSDAAEGSSERSIAGARVDSTSGAKLLEHSAASPASSGRTPVTERRAHFRHKIAAAVSLMDIGTGQIVEGDLADLARMGCNVKADTFFSVGAEVELTISRNSQSFRAQARVVSAVPDHGMGLVFTEVEPEQYGPLDQWIAASMKTSWLATVRRRSQRVLLKLPVHVGGRNKLGSDFSEDTHTISISAHGATVLLSTDVLDGQLLILRNLLTNGALECSVVYVGKAEDRGREVGVSFTLPNRTFWRVAFPPLGWSQNDPDAKRT
jgi:PilZ domain-containing protein